MSALARALLVVGALYVALLAVPSLPAPMGPGLDRSWILALKLARDQGLVAGRDIVWTYGPLGWLHVPTPAGEGSYAVLAYQAGVFFLWAGALVVLALAVTPRWLAAWLLVALGAARMLEPMPGGDGRSLEHLEAALLVLAMLVVARPPAAGRVALALLGTLAGVAALVKIETGGKAALLFLPLAAVAMARRPGSAVALLAPPLALIAGFAASTGQAHGLGAYLRYSWVLAAGYSEGMSYSGPYGTLALAAALLLALCLGVPLACRDRRSLAAGLAPAALLALLSFKHAVVRQDPAHSFPLAAQLAMFAGLPLLAAGTPRDRRVLVLFQTVCLGAAGWSLFRFPDSHPEELLDRLTLRSARTALRDAAAWPATWRRLEAQGRAALQPLRLDRRFHEAVGTGSVDAAPWEVAAIEANGWRWRPRPVFQSYSAYTPALDLLNAAHVRSARAADFVLLRWRSIDGRHPMFEAPLWWQTLLAAYEPAVQDDVWLLLRRRATARPSEPQLLAAVPARLGETLRAPASDGLLFLAADVHLSAAGSLQRALLRLSPLFLEVTYRSGRRESWRVVRATLPSGVLVSPLPQSVSHFAALASGRTDVADPLEGVRLWSARPYQFAGEIHAQWLSGHPSLSGNRP